MRDYVIMTDSSCDLPVELLQQNNVHVVPLGVTIGEKTFKQYPDYREMSKDEFYQALQNGETGHTAGTNIQDAAEMMTDIVKNGQDIIYLSLSSGLSCSYQNACLAAEEVLEEYPDAKIAVVDSLSVATGLGLLILKAAHYRDDGMDFNTALENIYDNIKDVRLKFVVEDLDALRRGGRISHLTASVGSMLNIKPLLHIDPNGKIQSFGKARGRKAALKQLSNDMIMSARDTTTFIIAHTGALDDAEEVKTTVEAAHPHANVIITEIGPVVSTHTGMKTMAFTYM